MLQDSVRTVSRGRRMLLLRQQLPEQQLTQEEKRHRAGRGGGMSWINTHTQNKAGQSDALEEVGVAVCSSSTVTHLPDSRPELHGAAVPHLTLRTGGRLYSSRFNQKQTVKLTLQTPVPEDFNRICFVTEQHKMKHECKMEGKWKFFYIQPRWVNTWKN